VVTDAQSRGIEARTELARRSPSNQIFAYADEENIDLIGNGWERASAINPVLLGSVADDSKRRRDVTVRRLEERSV
jgi:hypothetical protein